MLEDKEPPSIVKNVMAKTVITIDKDSSVHEAAKIMSEKLIGCIVVTDEDKPMGIATERDILQRVVAKGLDASKVKMKDIMSKPLITVSGDTLIINATRIMQKSKVRRLLVMEKGKIVGIITERDLLRALAFHVLISFRPLV
jgi:predicted transcriptional regulator